MNKVSESARWGQNLVKNHLAAYKDLTRLARFWVTRFLGGAERVHRHTPCAALGVVCGPITAPLADQGIWN